MECELCHSKFFSKQTLTYHLTHGVCTKENKTCPHCGFIFTTRSALLHHLSNKVCEGKTKPKIILKAHQQTQKPPEQTTFTNEQLALMLAQCQAEIKVLKERPHVIINNTSNTIHNTNTTTTTNIGVPPAFLSLEKYEYMSENFPNLLHLALAKHPCNFVLYLIQQLNCNPKRPLYNSVKITNRKDSYVKVSDGKKYVDMLKEKALDELIHNKRGLIQDYIDDNGDHYAPNTIRKCQDYAASLDDNKKVLKELKQEIIALILNVSDDIETDEWTQQLIQDLETFNNIDNKPAIEMVLATSAAAASTSTPSTAAPISAAAASTSTPSTPATSATHASKLKSVPEVESEHKLDSVSEPDSPDFPDFPLPDIDD